MRYFYLLATVIFGLLASPIMAVDWEDQRVFSGASPSRVLRILSSTDTAFFEPIIESYLQDDPTVTVEYFVSSTSDLDTIFRQTPKAFDVVISSAMDLQFKLTNDGYAMKVANLPHPDWAQWQQSLFAFTTEPAAIVINKNAFSAQPIPQSRQDLILALRARPDFFRERIGTYDVRKSGVGYLFATQDARLSETYWRLMEVMGSLQARLYCCSGDMIDDLESGKIAVAYNVLGSYAAARAKTSKTLEIILPSDFPTTMMRTALISRAAQNPEKAKNFLRHLLTIQAGGAYENALTLPSLMSRQDPNGQSTIDLTPALMTYLDDLKRATFIQEWSNAIIQN
ncbi:iron(III) transport system substrate-binding protein [Pacificibacter maritimus]|uniref:Iron(III) transport system substrate-binding protein n=1 Tax=Pacificibacter maritimus TaxID=762213 RepID=A0A3N4UQI6_9RHOB|nr:ABC transporter substrate-binding protein [Pacificibacter maritimus]RPE67237.1 iron(III) transport system substrate-binding protein [Pacificibacter maritimus]